MDSCVEGLVEGEWSGLSSESCEFDDSLFVTND